MKQDFFIILSFMTIIKAFDEVCAKQECLNVYERCMQDVFGCAAAYQNCKEQCGETEPCFQQCASKNQKLYDLYLCWEILCSGLTQKQKNCNIELCINIFENECLSTQNNKLLFEQQIIYQLIILFLFYKEKFKKQKTSSKLNNFIFYFDNRMHLEIPKQLSRVQLLK